MKSQGLVEKTKFIDEIVFGWIKSDLTRMVNTIRPDPLEKGNINFPLALCTLAYMEYLGGFLLGKNAGFANNVGKYIKECFSNKNEYPIEILRDLFRHGLAHEYFPRGAISRNGKRPAIYKGNNYDIVLDAETLVNDFIISLSMFANKLGDDAYEKRMKQAQNRINSEKNKYRPLIDDLERQPNDDDTATPSLAPPKETTRTTFNSNASSLDRIMYTTTDPNSLRN